MLNTLGITENQLQGQIQERSYEYMKSKRRFALWKEKSRLHSMVAVRWANI